MRTKTHMRHKTQRPPEVVQILLMGEVAGAIRAIEAADKLRPGLRQTVERLLREHDDVQAMLGQVPK